MPTIATDSSLISVYAGNSAWAVKDVLELEPILDVTLRWTQLVGLQIDWWWASHNTLAATVRQAFRNLQVPVAAVLQEKC